MLAVRRGQGMRAAARRFGVSLCTVQRWVKRARGRKLADADFEGRAPGCPSPPHKTTPGMELRILRTRRRLRDTSPLGEWGAAAVRASLLAGGVRHVPSVRTIGRIFKRHGLLDARRRVRRPPPPPGWFLPDLAKRRVELDSVDTVVDLVIAGQGGGKVDVTTLNAVSLHGGLCQSWPRARITAKLTCDLLIDHWRERGLPAYAKFDNDTVFQGARIRPDSFGRVTRLCLALGVVPVFAPPREHGFQADVESFNGRWQDKVFRRFRHPSLAALQKRSAAFVAASHYRHAQRIDAAPPRLPFPARWRFDLQRPLAGKVIYLRRTDDQGRVDVLGRKYLAARHWAHRLVRAELDLTAGRLSLYALRRREPGSQPLLARHPYAVPNRPFIE